MSVAGIVVGLVLELVGAALSAIPGAAILRTATRCACRFEISFKQAYIASLAAASLSLLLTSGVGAAVGLSLLDPGPWTLSAFICISCLVQSLLYAALIRHPVNGPIGIGNGVLVTALVVLLSLAILLVVLLFALLAGLAG